MLEDCQVMEKKPNGRSVQGGGTENKKALESTNKPFGKFTRRREPSGYNSSKNEGLRKANPPKSGKFNDKRPRPRGQYNSGGKADTKVADDDGPEYGSVFVPGSKKQNLNHLLNFHYAPRNVEVGGHSLGNRGRAGHKWLTTHKHKYNKEQFLQANCQFIVKEHEDYTKHLVDPDLLVEWNSIEQIRLQSAELSSCPICLDTPIAAKMTRCGHIFCWPCILHYLALSDKSWRKCPICYEAVHKTDLKSVVTQAFPCYNIGDTVTFRLMKRERGSLTPLPVDQSDKLPTTGLLSMSEKNCDTVHSKLLLAKPYEVMSILSVERAQLKDQLAENEGCPELCFIEQALEFLKEREALLQEAMEGRSAEGVTVDCATQLSAEDGLVSEMEALMVVEEMARAAPEAETLPAEEEESRTRLESSSSEEELPNIAAEDLEIAHHHSSTSLKPYYFYQAADGQHTYLHALNIKMLVVEHESLDLCPLQIHGRVVEKESGSMTEELRRRLRYLQHLPLTTQFDVIEIDLTGAVGADVLDSFSDQLETRVKRRIRRAREEKRRERRISDEVNSKWWRRSAPQIRIESHRQFPLCGTATEAELNQLATPVSLSRSQSVNSVSSGAMAAEEADAVVAEYSGPSFAQMLREGTSSGGKREANRKQVAWGSKLNREEWPAPQPAEPDEDGWAAAPLFRQTFSDAFADALERAELCQDESVNVTLKKRKKKKAKVLFVTGMAHHTK